MSNRLFVAEDGSDEQEAAGALGPAEIKGAFFDTVNVHVRQPEVKRGSSLRPAVCFTVYVRICSCGHAVSAVGCQQMVSGMTFEAIGIFRSMRDRLPPFQTKHSAYRRSLGCRTATRCPLLSLSRAASVTSGVAKAAHSAAKLPTISTRKPLYRMIDTKCAMFGARLWRSTLVFFQPLASVGTGGRGGTRSSHANRYLAAEADGTPKERATSWVED